MKRFALPVTTLLFLLGTGYGVSMAGELAGQALEPAPLKLLGGRVLVKMPKGAKIEARGPENIMGAAPSTEEEDRAVFEVGKEKLVLMASETFRTAGDDFEKKLREYFSGAWFGGFTLAPLKPVDAAAAEKVKGFLVWPTRVQLEGDARLVAIAAILLPDKTVLTLDVYVNPVAYQDKPGYRKLAEAILASVQPGEKKLSLEGGARQVGRARGNKALALELPAGFVMTVTRGPDFDIYNFLKVVPLGESGNDFSIYEGNAPAYQYVQSSHEEGSVKPAVRKVAGKLFDRDVTWHTWLSGSGQELRKHWEAMLPAPLPGNGGDMAEILHIFFSGRTDDEVAALRKIVETLKVVDVREKPDAKAPDKVPAKTDSSATPPPRK